MPIASTRTGDPAGRSALAAFGMLQAAVRSRIVPRFRRRQGRDQHGDRLGVAQPDAASDAADLKRGIAQGVGSLPSSAAATASRAARMNASIRFVGHCGRCHVGTARAVAAALLF